jgi:LmbE family N-acetylglucosaminyl deacetylase
MSTRASIAPDDLLSNRILIVAPHMDDEVLGCGGIMHMHTDKTQIHCIYATDGARSPAPLLPWTGSIDPDITEHRRREAIEVMDEVGIPRENLIFLDFPDGKLMKNSMPFKARLAEQIARIEPAVILVPFRYDLHPDHVAVHRGARDAVLESPGSSILLEYFIYFRWRLIKSGDVRQSIPASRLLNIDTGAVADKKSATIYRYASQTGIHSDWQEQPILTSSSISERCSEPECFLYSDPHEPLSAIFTGNRFRIVAAHFIERIGKRRKDQLLALLSWLFRSGRRQNA